MTDLRDRLRRTEYRMVNVMGRLTGSMDIVPRECLANPDGPEAVAEIDRLSTALRAADERERELRSVVEDVASWSSWNDETEFVFVRQAKDHVNRTIEAARQALRGKS